MINLLILLVALALGYSLVVFGMLGATFGLGALRPGFVVANFKIGAGYKRLHSVVWLLLVTLGGFVSTAAVVLMQGAYPWAVGVVLAALLLTILWRNKLEARQRGTAHQVLMSVATIVGVGIGFYLAHVTVPS